MRETASYCTDGIHTSTMPGLLLNAAGRGLTTTSGRASRVAMAWAQAGETSLWKMTAGVVQT